MVHLRYQQPVTVVGVGFDVREVLVLANSCDVEGVLSYLREVRNQIGHVSVYVGPDQSSVDKQLR